MFFPSCFFRTANSSMLSGGVYGLVYETALIHEQAWLPEKKLPIFHKPLSFTWQRFIYSNYSQQRHWYTFNIVTYYLEADGFFYYPITVD